MIIKMTSGNKDINVDGKIIKNDVAPVEIDNRTMVPLRFISELYNKIVDWNPETDEVTISTRKKYFETADDAAFDWSMYFNAMSIALFKEMGAVIKQDENGFYWDNVIIGNDKEVYWSIPSVRKGVAFIHSHSGGKETMTKNMSSADFSTAKKMGRVAYMVDSAGSLHRYDPNVTPKKQVFVKKGAPVDAKHMDTAESLKFMKEYFENAYKEISTDTNLGYVADFYNKMYLDDIKYNNINFKKLSDN